MGWETGGWGTTDIKNVELKNEINVSRGLPPEKVNKMNFTLAVVFSSLNCRFGRTLAASASLLSPNTLAYAAFMVRETISSLQDVSSSQLIHALSLSPSVSNGPSTRASGCERKTK